MSEAVLDTEDLFGAAAALARGLREAVAAGLEVAPPPSGTDVRSIVLAGSGEAGLAADVVACIMGGASPLPVVVVKDGVLPEFAGPGTLVVAMSPAGETPFAVEAAKATDASCVVLPERSPGRRLSAPALAVEALVALDRAGFTAGVRGEVEKARTRLEEIVPKLITGAPDGLNVARRVARCLRGRFPLVYGASGPAAVAAHAWKCAVNTNVKAPSFWNSIPEAGYSEICGWGVDGDVTRQLLTLVTLRWDGESERVRRQFDATVEVVEETVAGVVDVRAETTSALAAFCELYAVGEFVTLFMAADRSVDPGPTEAIERFAGPAPG